MKYTVVIERSATGYSAYVPDLPGCVAAAETKLDVVRLLEEAIVLHIAGMREDGQPVPTPVTETSIVEIPG